jgi:chromosome segregation ATPase
MAKKKVTRQAEVHKEEAAQPQDQSQTHQAKPMDDPSEKLQNLKSLNSLLLKETFERRQQVESLEQAKQALEAELNRSGMEKKALEAELTWVSEESVGLELEKSVIFAFWETQMVEIGVGFDGLVREKGEIEKMKCEREAEIGFLKKEANELVANLENERGRLSQVCRERDLLKTEIDDHVQEANGLRENMVEMEKKDKRSVEEIEKLKVECEGLLKEKLETEKAVKALKRQKESVQGNLEQSMEVINSLKSEIEGVIRAKSEVERERTTQEVKIGELEKEVGELNGIVMTLREEEEILHAKVLELEKMIGQAMDKEKEMALQINVLVEEKREKEQNIEKLKDQKDSVQRILDMTSKESEGRLQKIEELIREESEIGKLKLSLESKIVHLETEVDSLRNAISTLRESCRDEEDKNKQLVIEVGRFRGAFDRLTLERDEVQKGFDEERKKVKSMEVVVLEKEKRIEETVEELGQMRSERENLIERNKAIESSVEVLVKEKDLVQKNLVEAQRGIDDLRAKMESAGINSKRALSMMKNTAALVCHSTDDRDSKEKVVINEQKLEEEIQPYAVELDAIKNAFRNKEKMVEDMKKQVDFLQSSVAEAHKRKSFWTLVSSATTIVAAASVAYVARGR